MFAVQRSLTALVFGSLLASGGRALAADEPVATADPNTPSVAAQIDDYLKTSPATELPKDTVAGITSGEEEPRKVHGVVDVGVGAHGYRSAYVRSDFPVGKTGTLSVAVEDTRFKGRFGGFGSRPYRGQNVALGLAFGGDADRRCRDAIVGPGRHRIDPMLTGPIDGDRAHDCDRQDPPPEGR